MHKIGIRELVDMLKKEKAQCEETLTICKKAIKESLSHRSVWLQEKERMEKRIKEINRSLERLEKYL
jgi:hypothetical protein